MKVYVNGNREVILNERDGKHSVQSAVWDGTKYQYGTCHAYKTAANAERAAAKQVTAISEGWTQEPTWTITETK